MEKINLAGFLKLPVFISYRDDTDGKDKLNKTRASLNPLSITAFWPSEIKNEDGSIINITKVDCGHYTWLVDISYKEFEQFFDAIDRGFEYTEKKDE